MGSETVLYPELGAARNQQSQQPTTLPFIEAIDQFDTPFVHFNEISSASFALIKIMSCDCLRKPESIYVVAGEGMPHIDIIGYLKESKPPTNPIPN